MGSGSGSASASEAASLVFRIATVGLSLASAIMTAASTQCVYRDGGGAPTATAVSYADYPSFKYSAVADLVSAVLQGVAIYLEATRKEKAAASRAVELIDKLVQALTATSAALLFAVDDITSCGGPPRGRGSGRQQQRQGGLCGQAGGALFCGRVRVASALSVAATVSVSASVYTRHVPVVDALLAPRTPAAATNVNVVNVIRRGDGGRRKKEEEEEEEEKREVVVVELIVPEEEKMAKEVERKEEEKKDQDQVVVVQNKDDDNGGGEETKKKNGEAEEECSWSTLQTQACPPPWCRCPRLTIPCGCEDPELCGAFF